MKNLLTIILLWSLLMGCKTLKTDQNPNPGRVQGRGNQPSVIAFSADPTADPSKDFFNTTAFSGDDFTTTASIENSYKTAFRYSILMDIEVEQLTNKNLYQYIDNWWATPYRYGGADKTGVDCSAFVQGLFASVYGISIPRTTREQKAQCFSLLPTGLREGDLVFFNTRGGVSHVGIYLHNQRFVHASTSGGVMISDLNEPYWNRRFLGAGRMPGSNASLQGSQE